MNTIGRYQIVAKLGHGGMGIVYRAFDPTFNREVAIKVLPQQFASDPTLRARFEREARVVAALEHPAIVPVYDFGEVAGQPYLVMRYMAGGSLADRLVRGPLPAAEALRILAHLAPALDLAHSRGVVHRDLKPANILFDSQGSPYIADFGIAKIAEATVSLTSSGAIGTPAYMSPEQAQGQELDGRSDIYALGVILFEMLTGRQPYQGTTPVSIAMKHVLEPVPHLREVAPHLSPALDAVVQQAMAKQRNARFASATALVNALRAASAAEKVAATRERAVPSAASSPSATHVRVERSRTTPSGAAWPLWGLVGVLVVVVLLLLVGVSLLGRQAPPRSSTLAAESTTAVPTASLASSPPILPPVAPTSITSVAPTATPLPAPTAAPTATAAATATPAPTTAPTIPSVAVGAGSRYVTFPLQGLANAAMTEGYVDPPLGRVTLGGVLFDLGVGGSVTTQAVSLPDNPKSAVLRVDVAAPQEVALLLTGGNLFRRFQGQRVGLVRLAFADGAEHQVPLVAGENLREWKLSGDGMVTAASSPLLLEVWRGGNRHDNGVAVIDLLRIPIPTEMQSDRLTAIEVRDLSLEMLGDLDPAINWLGVSVLSGASSQPQATAQRAVNLRTGPSQDFDRIRLLPPGEVVSILGRTAQGDWLQVKTSDGATGWVSAPYLTIDNATIAALPVVVTPTLVPCSIEVDGRLRSAYGRNTLGCPVSNARIVWAAWQPFERGAMLWRDDVNQVTVFYQGAGWTTLPDQWDQVTAAPSRGAAPPGLQAPVRGFGWIWGTRDEVFNGLGWATDQEKGVCLLLQDFEHGFVFAKSGASSCADRRGGSNYSRAAELPPLFIAAYSDGAGWRSQ